MYPPCEGNRQVNCGGALSANADELGRDVERDIRCGGLMHSILGNIPVLAYAWPRRSASTLSHQVTVHL